MARRGGRGAAQRRPRPAAARTATAPAAEPAPSTAPRVQRVLAGMAFALIGVSALAVVALLVLHGAGVPDTAFRTGGLVVLVLLPLPGLTIGLLLVIAVIVMTAVGRARS